MLFRVLQTRRASADGVTTQTFLRGRVYDRPDAFVRQHFPDGTYEVSATEQAGPGGDGGTTGRDSGTPAAPPLPSPASPDKGKRRWLRRNGGA